MLVVESSDGGRSPTSPVSVAEMGGSPDHHRQQQQQDQQKKQHGQRSGANGRRPSTVRDGALAMARQQAAGGISGSFATHRFGIVGLPPQALVEHPKPVREWRKESGQYLSANISRIHEQLRVDRDTPAAHRRSSHDPTPVDTLGPLEEGRWATAYRTSPLTVAVEVPETIGHVVRRRTRKVSVMVRDVKRDKTLDHFVVVKPGKTVLEGLDQRRVFEVKFVMLDEFAQAFQRTVIIDGEFDNMGSASSAVVVETDAPAVSSVTPIPFRVVFSSASVGLEPAHMTVSGGDVVNWTIVGDTIYSFGVEPPRPGRVLVHLAENAFKGNRRSNLVEVTYSLRPTVKVRYEQHGASSPSSVAFSATFSSEVVGFTADHAVVRNGNVVSVSQEAEDEYLVEVRPGRNGLVSMHVPENAVYAAADETQGNMKSNTAKTRFDGFTADQAASAQAYRPTLLLNNGVVRSKTFAVTVVLSKPVKDFGPSQVTVEGGIVETVKYVNPFTYSVVVSATRKGFVSTRVTAGTLFAAEDGKPLPASNLLAVTYEPAGEEDGSDADEPGDEGDIIMVHHEESLLMRIKRAFGCLPGVAMRRQLVATTPLEDALLAKGFLHFSREIDRLTRELEVQKHRADRSKAAVEELTVELGKIGTSAARPTRYLIEELDRTRRERDAALAAARHSDVRHKVAVARAERRELWTQMSRAAAFEAKAASQDAAVANLEGQLAGLREAIGQDGDARCQHLVRMVLEAKRESRDLQSRLAESASRERVLGEKVALLERQVQTIRADDEWNRLADALEAREVDVLELYRQIEDTRGENAGLKADIAALKQQSSPHDAEPSETESLQKRCAVAEARCKVLQMRIANYQTQNMGGAAESAHLRRQLTASENHVLALLDDFAVHTGVKPAVQPPTAIDGLDDADDASCSAYDAGENTRATITSNGSSRRDEEAFDMDGQEGVQRTEVALAGGDEAATSPISPLAVEQSLAEPPNQASDNKDVVAGGSSAVADEQGVGSAEEHVHGDGSQQVGDDGTLSGGSGARNLKASSSFARARELPSTHEYLREQIVALKHQLEVARSDDAVRSLRDQLSGAVSATDRALGMLASALELDLEDEEVTSAATDEDEGNMTNVSDYEHKPDAHGSRQTTLTEKRAALRAVALACAAETARAEMHSSVRNAFEAMHKTQERLVEMSDQARELRAESVAKAANQKQSELRISELEGMVRLISSSHGPVEAKLGQELIKEGQRRMDVETKVARLESDRESMLARYQTLAEFSSSKDELQRGISTQLASLVDAQVRSTAQVVAFARALSPAANYVSTPSSTAASMNEAEDGAKADGVLYSDDAEKGMYAAYAHLEEIIRERDALRDALLVERSFNALLLSEEESGPLATGGMGEEGQTYGGALIAMSAALQPVQSLLASAEGSVSRLMDDLRFSSEEVARLQKGIAAADERAKAAEAIAVAAGRGDQERFLVGEVRRLRAAKQEVEAASASKDVTIDDLRRRLHVLLMLTQAGSLAEASLAGTGRFSGGSGDIRALNQQHKMSSITKSLARQNRLVEDALSWRRACDAKDRRIGELLAHISWRLHEESVAESDEGDAQEDSENTSAIKDLLRAEPSSIEAAAMAATVDVGNQDGAARADGVIAAELEVVRDKAARLHDMCGDLERDRNEIRERMEKRVAFAERLVNSMMSERAELRLRVSVSEEEASALRRRVHEAERDRSRLLRSTVDSDVVSGVSDVLQSVRKERDEARVALAEEAARFASSAAELEAMRLKCSVLDAGHTAIVRLTERAERNDKAVVTLLGRLEEAAAKIESMAKKDGASKNRSGGDGDEVAERKLAMELLLVAAEVRNSYAAPEESTAEAAAALEEVRTRSEKLEDVVLELGRQLAKERAKSAAMRAQLDEQLRSLERSDALLSAVAVGRGAGALAEEVKTLRAGRDELLAKLSGDQAKLEAKEEETASLQRRVKGLSEQVEALRAADRERLTTGELRLQELEMLVRRALAQGLMRPATTLVSVGKAGDKVANATAIVGEGLAAGGRASRDALSGVWGAVAGATKAATGVGIGHNGSGSDGDEATHTLLVEGHLHACAALQQAVDEGNMALVGISAEAMEAKIKAATIKAALASAEERASALQSDMERVAGGMGADDYLVSELAKSRDEHAAVRLELTRVRIEAQHYRDMAERLERPQARAAEARLRNGLLRAVSHYQNVIRSLASDLEDHCLRAVEAEMQADDCIKRLRTAEADLDALVPSRSGDGRDAHLSAASQLGKVEGGVNEPETPQPDTGGAGEDETDGTNAEVSMFGGNMVASSGGEVGDDVYMSPRRGFDELRRELVVARAKLRCAEGKALVEKMNMLGAGAEDKSDFVDLARLASRGLQAVEGSESAMDEAARLSSELLEAQIARVSMTSDLEAAEARIGEMEADLEALTRRQGVNHFSAALETVRAERDALKKEVATSVARIEALELANGRTRADTVDIGAGRERILEEQVRQLARRHAAVVRDLGAAVREATEARHAASTAQHRLDIALVASRGDDIEGTDVTATAVSMAAVSTTEMSFAPRLAAKQATIRVLQEHLHAAEIGIGLSIAHSLDVNGVAGADGGDDEANDGDVLLRSLTSVLPLPTIPGELRVGIETPFPGDRGAPPGGYAGWALRWAEACRTRVAEAEERARKAFDRNVTLQSRVDILEGEKEACQLSLEATRADLAAAGASGGAAALEAIVARLRASRDELETSRNEVARERSNANAAKTKLKSAESKVDALSRLITAHQRRFAHNVADNAKLLEDFESSVHKASQNEARAAALEALVAALTASDAGEDELVRTDRRNLVLEGALGDALKRASELEGQVVLLRRENDLYRASLDRPESDILTAVWSDQRGLVLEVDALLERAAKAELEATSLQRRNFELMADVEQVSASNGTTYLKDRLLEERARSDAANSAAEIMKVKLTTISERHAALSSRVGAILQENKVLAATLATTLAQMRLMPEFMPMDIPVSDADVKDTEHGFSIASQLRVAMARLKVHALFTDGAFSEIVRVLAARDARDRDASASAAEEVLGQLDGVLAQLEDAKLSAVTQKEELEGARRRISELQADLAAAASKEGVAHFTASVETLRTAKASLEQAVAQRDARIQILLAREEAANERANAVEAQLAGTGTAEELVRLRSAASSLADRLEAAVASQAQQRTTDTRVRRLEIEVALLRSGNDGAIAERLLAIEQQNESLERELARRDAAASLASDRISLGMVSSGGSRGSNIEATTLLRARTDLQRAVIESNRRIEQRLQDLAAGGGQPAALAARRELYAALTASRIEREELLDKLADAEARSTAASLKTQALLGALKTAAVGGVGGAQIREDDLSATRGDSTAIDASFIDLSRVLDDLTEATVRASAAEAKARGLKMRADDAEEQLGLLRTAAAAGGGIDDDAADALVRDLARARDERDALVTTVEEERSRTKVAEMRAALATSAAVLAAPASAAAAGARLAAEAGSRLAAHADTAVQSAALDAAELAALRRRVRELATECERAKKRDTKALLSDNKALRDERDAIARDLAIAEAAAGVADLKVDVSIAIVPLLAAADVLAKSFDGDDGDGRTGEDGVTAESVLRNSVTAIQAATERAAAIEARASAALRRVEGLEAEVERLRMGDEAGVLAEAGQCRAELADALGKIAGLEAMADASRRRCDVTVAVAELLSAAGRRSGGVGMRSGSGSAEIRLREIVDEFGMVLERSAASSGELAVVRKRLVDLEEEQRAAAARGDHQGIATEEATAALEAARRERDEVVQQHAELEARASTFEQKALLAVELAAAIAVAGVASVGDGGATLSGASTSSGIQVGATVAKVVVARAAEVCSQKAAMEARLKAMMQRAAEAVMDAEALQGGDSSATDRVGREGGGAVDVAKETETLRAAIAAANLRADLAEQRALVAEAATAAGAVIGGVGGEGDDGVESGDAQDIAGDGSIVSDIKSRSTAKDAIGALLADVEAWGKAASAAHAQLIMSEEDLRVKEDAAMQALLGDQDRGDEDVILLRDFEALKAARSERDNLLIELALAESRIEVAEHQQRVGVALRSASATAPYVTLAASGHAKAVDWQQQIRSLYDHMGDTETRVARALSASFNSRTAESAESKPTSDAIVLARSLDDARAEADELSRRAVESAELVSSAQRKAQFALAAFEVLAHATTTTAHPHGESAQRRVLSMLHDLVDTYDVANVGYHGGDDAQSSGDGASGDQVTIWAMSKRFQLSVAVAALGAGSDPATYDESIATAFSMIDDVTDQKGKINRDAEHKNNTILDLKRDLDTESKLRMIAESRVS